MRRQIKENISVIIASYTSYIYHFYPKLSIIIILAVQSKEVAQAELGTIVQPFVACGNAKIGTLYYEVVGNILLWDVRDDSASPAVASGDVIYGYLLFDGVQAVDNTPYLGFFLISLEQAS